MACPRLVRRSRSKFFVLVIANIILLFLFGNLRFSTTTTRKALPRDSTARDNSETRVNVSHVLPSRRHDEQSPWKHALPYNESHRPDLFQKWEVASVPFCNQSFTGFAHMFASLKEVVVDRTKCTSKLKGGENISLVMEQQETDEYYICSLGFYQQNCLATPNYTFTKGHLNDWVKYLLPKPIGDNAIYRENEFHIAILRHEYANLYMTMTDWYNAFLVMNFFNKTGQDTNVLMVDTHPVGLLDATWSVLFNSKKRLSSLPEQTLFRHLTWNIVGYQRPLMRTSLKTLPLLEKFRKYFLQSFGISADDHQRDCKKLNILFIWRRDYVAHPRNPSGIIARKIDNENELLESIQKQYPDFKVQGVQLDVYDMRQQLAFMAETDIFIGMHGAGLTHALFVPRGGSLIELFPQHSTNNHFQCIAKWSGLSYQKWTNTNPHHNKPNKTTYIPTEVPIKLIEKAMKPMCLN